MNDCRLIVRDRLFLFWTLVLPLFFVFVFVKAFAGSGEKERTILYVLNQDQGKWGDYLAGQIHHPDLDVRVRKKENQISERLLIIPADFSRNIEKRRAQSLVFRSREGVNIQASTQVEVSIMQAIVRSLAEIAANTDPGTFFSGGRKTFRQLIEVKAEFPSQAPLRVPSGVDHQVPGTLVHFLLMNILIAGGFTLLIDRERGIFTRVLYSPVGVPGLWLGKFLGRWLVAVIQAFLFIVFGILLFRFHLGNIILTMLVVFTFTLAVTSLSMFLGSIVRNEDLMVGLSVLLANLMAAFGGCWWPIEIVGKPFRTIGMAFPTYWAMDGFHQVVFYGAKAAAILPNLLIMCGFCLLFAFLSFPFFKIRR